MGAARYGPPVDPGLQEERTRLAWRRTGLSLAVGTLVVGRLVATRLGEGLIAPTLLVAACAVWAAMSGLRRGAGSRPSEREPAFSFVLRDGRLPAVVAGVAALLCLAQLAGALRPLWG